MKKAPAKTWPSLLGLLLFLLVPLGAWADDPEPALRKIGIAASGKNLLADFSFSDAFTPQIRKKLKSGLPTRIVLQINLEREGASRPITFWVRSTSIVYDLWEEVFIISVEDGQGRRRAKTKTAKEAIELAGTMFRERVAYVGGQPAGIYRFRVLVEVNPVSKEMVENIRRWLAKPQTNKSGEKTQSNFFGSFVGIFVDRRIGKADKVVSFVSQWFRLGET